MTSTCGAEEDVKTYSEGQCNFCSVLSSMEGQGAIHYNIVGAVVSNVYYYGCKIQKENPI
jgi:hypothetical protein